MHPKPRKVRIAVERYRELRTKKKMLEGPSGTDVPRGEVITIFLPKDVPLSGRQYGHVNRPFCCKFMINEFRSAGEKTLQRRLRVGERRKMLCAVRTCLRDARRLTKGKEKAQSRVMCTGSARGSEKHLPAASCPVGVLAMPSSGVNLQI